MKKIKILLFTILLGSAFFTSCSEGIGDDINIVGSDLTDSPVIIGWGKPAVTESYFSDIGILNNTYPLNVIGGADGSPTTSDITVTLTVDTANSTAVEGNEFTFPSSSVTIPAGTKIGLVPININTGAFNPTEPTQVIINATTTSEGVVVSALSQKLVMNFVGCLSTLDSYTYNVTITRENTGAVVQSNGEVLTKLDVNYFETETVGHWPLSPGVRFSEICGNLYMQSHDLADTYSNQVTAGGGPNNLTGTVDENGNFTLRYDISSTFGYYTAVYTRQ